MQVTVRVTVRVTVQVTVQVTMRATVQPEVQMVAGVALRPGASWKRAQQARSGEHT
jgi:hypothetical protein